LLINVNISAIDALKNWKNVIDNGDMAGLDNVLEDDFIFENRVGDQEGRDAVLKWANNADFTFNEFIFYHEDESVICGRHSFEEPKEPKQQVMFFTRYENSKCKFWKVHDS
jgi:hypothetical protein